MPFYVFPSDYYEGAEVKYSAGDVVELTATEYARIQRERPGVEIIQQMVPQSITDPGDAGAIPVTDTGYCDLVTTGAETRTLAAPSFDGQMIQLNFKTDGGDCVVTCSTGVNQTGNDTLTFADAGDYLLLQAGRSGANLRWRVVANDGVALSTA